MNKILIAITAFALSLSLANAQQNQYGDGSGTMDGSGPNGGTAGMWTGVEDAVNGLADGELKTQLTNALSQVTQLRETLRLAREENPDWTVEDFRNAYGDEIGELKGAVETLRNWFRENRPDRPDPLMTGEMVQRRNRFQANTENLTQLRKRLRELSSSDPDSAECDQVREQIRQALGERKGLLREQRRGEGGQSGDGNRKRGG